MIKYSIITIGYKAEEYTQKCIESVAKHTKNHEHILVLNESDISQFNYQLTIINNIKNVGLSKAANQGIRIARGQYIFITANDIEVQRDWVKPYVREIDKGASMVIGTDMSVHCYDKDWLITCGLYDENIFFEYEDIEMQKRVWLSGKKMTEIEAKPFKHHLHKSGDLLGKVQRDEIRERSRNYVNYKYNGWEPSNDPAKYREEI